MDTDCDEFETEIETSGKCFSLRKNFKTAAAPCIPLMQLNILRHRLMQHFTRLVRNVKR